jgi:hypothetical protein
MDAAQPIWVSLEVWCTSPCQAQHLLLSMDLKCQGPWLMEKSKVHIHESTNAEKHEHMTTNIWTLSNKLPRNYSTELLWLKTYTSMLECMYCIQWSIITPNMAST